MYQQELHKLLERLVPEDIFILDLPLTLRGQSMGRFIYINEQDPMTEQIQTVIHELLHSVPPFWGQREDEILEDKIEQATIEFSNLHPETRNSIKQKLERAKDLGTGDERTKTRPLNDLYGYYFAYLILQNIQRR